MDKNIKFNIILFQIGDFYEKSILFNYNIDCIKKEFPNDNIIIFHSFEEIEQQYNIPHNKYYNLFRHNKIAFSDFVRLYLSNYFENMLYIDLDINILPGCRNRILEVLEENENDSNSDHNFIRFEFGYAMFYNKKKNSTMDDYIEYFTNQCVSNNRYILDVDFSEYLVSIKSMYYDISQYRKHYMNWPSLVNSDNLCLYSDINFCRTKNEQNHEFFYIPMYYFNYGNKVNINIVKDDKLPENYWQSYADISRQWMLMSESFFNNFFLKELKNKYDLLIVAPYGKYNSIEKDLQHTISKMFPTISYKIITINNTNEKYDYNYCMDSGVDVINVNEKIELSNLLQIGKYIWFLDSRNIVEELSIEAEFIKCMYNNDDYLNIYNNTQQICNSKMFC